jgi:hypothetical protein
MKRSYILALVAFCAALQPSHAVAALAPPVEVYWDLHPGNVGHPTAYTPSARYSLLVDHLTPLGYHITEGAAELNAVDLTSTKILVISAVSNGIGIYSPAALASIESFVNQGGGLLLMSDFNGTSGTDRLQQVLGLFGASMKTGEFDSRDVQSTSIVNHPAVKDVTGLSFNFSSPLNVGQLTPTIFHNQQVMAAAGFVGLGRVAVIADTEPFAKSIIGWPHPFDQPTHRQLATSTFAWLAIPEPATLSIVLTALGALSLVRRRAKSTAPR